MSQSAVIGRIKYLVCPFRFVGYRCTS